MAFEELKEHTEDVQKQAKEYLENSIAYYKLLGFKVAVKSTTMILKYALLVIALMMVLFFCSVAAALAIGKSLDSYTLGFLIVGGIYFVLTSLLFLFKDKFIEGPLLEKFQKSFLTTNMETKRYSSYEEIERALEIMMVKKELNFQKTVLSVQKTKENLQPLNIIKGFLGDYKSILTKSSGAVFNIIVPILAQWFTNKKRGK